MEIQTSGHASGGAWGAVSSLVWYAVKIDFSQWATNTGLKVIEVAIVGLVGGAMGLVGQHLIKKYILKTKN